MQIIIGIGAKPAVGPFENVGLDTTVGGIEVTVRILFWELLLPFHQDVHL